MSILAARDRFETSAGGLKPPLAAAAADKEKEKKEKKSSSDDPWEKAVKDALKSGEWKEVKDSSGKTYYYNTKTKKTTWDLKKELKKQADDSAPASAASPSPASPSRPATAESPAPAAQPTTTTTTTAVADPTASSPTAAPNRQPTPTPAPQPAAVAQPPVAAPPTNAASTSSVPPPSSRLPAPASAPAQPQPAPSFTADLPGIVPYVDPVERLLKHNEDLRKVLAGGSRGQIALDFQQQFDALTRTNSALNVQLERLRSENQSMAMALTEANKKIHEQQAQLARYQPTPERSKDDELALTLSHLREQNRVLVTQCAELSTMLARGLNETAARVADQRAANQQGDGVGSAAATASESGARLISRFLDSGARHALCPNCVLSVTRYRDKLLGPTDTNVGRQPLGSSPNARFDPYAAVGGSAMPVYKAVSDITSPPPSHYYSEPAAAAGGGGGTMPASASAFSYGVPPAATAGASAAIRSGQHAAVESPPVMFGGFVVRNARVPS